MKVAVSGPSGLIGSALVPAPEAAGHAVLRLMRREQAAADAVPWDPDAGTIDAARLSGVDALVTLSDETIGQRWTDKRRAEILQSRVSTAGLLAPEQRPSSTRDLRSSCRRAGRSTAC